MKRKPTTTRRAKPKADEERSLENPANPLTAAMLSDVLGYGPTRSGVQINEHTALTNTAVFAAIKVLSESVGALPMVVMEGDEDSEERKPALDHPLYGLLRREPNPEMSSVVFKETMQGHLVGWGNCYAAIRHDQGGMVREIRPLRPDRTYPERKAGRLQYRSESDTGGTDTFAAEEILHVPALGFDGIKGYSPIAMAREMIASGKAAEIFGSSFWGNGATTRGIIKSPQKMNPVQEQGLRESWHALYSGVQNAHKTAVLSGGAEYVPMTIPPDEAQFIETRKFSVLEVARIYRIPPHMLADLGKATSGNIEQQSLEFLIYTLLPWLEKWEAEINRKLFRGGNFHVRFNDRRLLRTDTSARQQYHAMARQWGWESTNDVRREEGMSPIGPEGDIYLSPANMNSAKDVAAGKVAPVPVTGAKPGGPAATAPGVSTAARAMQDVFADAIGRMLQRESAVAGKGKADEAFYAVHSQHVRDALYPAARSLLTILGRPLDRNTGISLDAALAEVAQERHGELNGNLFTVAAERAEMLIERISDETRYNDKHEQDGKFGEGGGGKSGSKKNEQSKTASTKSELAKQNATYVGKDIQRYSEEHNEPIAAKKMGGVSLRDNEPVDVVVIEKGTVKHGVELKTMVANGNAKITMKGSAIDRKAAWMKENNAPFHTVVMNDQKVFNAGGKGKHDDSQRTLLYRRGYGSFRTANMHECKNWAEVKTLMNTPTHLLPDKAKPGDNYREPKAKK